MKNILLVGLGSIGQRHYRNLKKINKNFNFFSIRKIKKSPLLSNDNRVIKKRLNNDNINIKEINYKNLKNTKIDLAFITNPTSMHVETAIKLVKAKCNIFIEKPISHNMKNLKSLIKLIKLKKVFCAVGFQTRYDELLSKIKKIILKKKYGKIKSVYIEHRHYLPYHHKYEDYKKSYAANKNLGGGVLLCFSHETDYANYLFGEPRRISSKIFFSKKLNINVESQAIFKIIYKNNIKVNFNLDFLKKKPSRYCAIEFEKAKLKWNLLKNKILIKKKKKNIITYSSSKLRNDLFIKELKEVLKSIKNKKQPKSNISNGLKNLKTIIDIKRANNRNIYL